MELNLHTRYHYNTLGDTEQAFYRFLIECLERLELKFNIFRDESQIPDSTERSSLPTFRVTDDPYDIFYDMVPIIYEWMLLDFPEFYYLEGEELVLDRERGYAVVGDGAIEYTPDEIAEFNAELEKIVHRFDGITDDYELELAVNDFVVESYEYDHEHNDYKGRDFIEVFTVVGFLRKKKAVCEAYTDLAQLILQRHGIPCAHVVGNAGSEDDVGLHAWLAVKIKGDYYQLDVTFNDTERNVDEPRYMYFNLTDDEIRRNHEFVSEYYPGIICNSRAYNYYVKNGLYFTDCDRVEAYVRSVCSDEHTAGERVWHYFRTAEQLPVEDVNNAIIRGINGTREYDAYACEYGYYSVVFY